MLTFPFWVTIERRRLEKPTDHIPCDTPTAPHVFTSTDRLVRFLDARHGGSWKIDRITNRDDCVGLIADMHNASQPGVCVDPEPDGSGGQLLTLPVLLRICANGQPEPLAG